MAKGFSDPLGNNVYYTGSKKGVKTGKNTKVIKRDGLAFNPGAKAYPTSPYWGGGYAPSNTVSSPDQLAQMAQTYGLFQSGAYGKGPTSDTMPVAPGPGGGGGADDKNWSDSGGELFNEWTGFAKDYTGTGADILYDDPRILVRDTLKQMGYNPNDGLMDLLGEKAGDLQYLAMLGLGAGADSANSQTTENYINFANEWAKNMTTPGAGMPDYNQMIQSILDAPEGSAIKAALEGGTPQEQAAMLNNLVQVASGSMTPLMQRALGRVMQDRTDDWLSTKAKGGKDPLANWLQQGGKGITG